MSSRVVSSTQTSSNSAVAGVSHRPHFRVQAHVRKHMVLYHPWDRLVVSNARSRSEPVSNTTGKAQSTPRMPFTTEAEWVSSLFFQLFCRVAPLVRGRSYRVLLPLGPLSGHDADRRVAPLGELVAREGGRAMDRPHHRPLPSCSPCSAPPFASLAPSPPSASQPRPPRSGPEGSRRLLCSTRSPGSRRRFRSSRRSSPSEACPRQSSSFGARRKPD